MSNENEKPVYINVNNNNNDSNKLHGFRHFLHLFLSVITMGVWFPIYILLYLFRNKNYYR